MKEVKGLWKEGSLNAGQLFTMDLSVGITEREKRKYPSNERSNGNTIPWTKGRGGRNVLSAWFAPKRRAFSLSKHLARVGGDLFNRDLLRKAR